MATGGRGRGDPSGQRLNANEVISDRKQSTGFAPVNSSLTLTNTEEESPHFLLVFLHMLSFFSLFCLNGCAVE